MTSDTTHPDHVTPSPTLSSDELEFTIDKMEIRTRSGNGEKELHYKIPARTIRGNVHSKYIHLVIENPMSHDRYAKPLPKAAKRESKDDTNGSKMIQGRWGGKFRNLWVDAGVSETYMMSSEDVEGENRENKKRRVEES